MKVIDLVIPCYNEEEVLKEISSRLYEKMGRLIGNKIVSDESKIVFIDDGSSDKTWSIIEALTKESSMFSGVKLSRNRGHQNALIAGLMTIRDHCDAIISLDADLQDDINVIDEFIEKYYEDCDVVYGVRSERKTDTAFKRNTAKLFYKLMKGLGVDIVYNHADYRLMSKKALYALGEFKEVNLFLRGIVPLVGFKSDTVIYERKERFAGESKYPLKKMLAFAFEGITSFSVKPIRLVLTIGILMFITSLLSLMYFLVIWLNGKAVAGWTTIVISIWMIGGIQLLCLGIIGEYVGKIYTETKRRPRFILDKLILKDND